MWMHTYALIITITGTGDDDAPKQLDEGSD